MSYSPSTSIVTSAPADMLYEPSFEIVAEWRDPSVLASMREHDAVVESMMSWMEELDYALKPLPGDSPAAPVSPWVMGAGVHAARPRRQPAGIPPPPRRGEMPPSRAGLRASSTLPRAP